jgi:hypothetical protein
MTSTGKGIPLKLSIGSQQVFELNSLPDLAGGFVNATEPGLTPHCLVPPAPAFVACRGEQGSLARPCRISKVLSLINDTVSPAYWLFWR